MPSNQLDFANFFATTLASTITASDTVIYLNSLPTPSEGYLVIEPDSTTAREIIYYTSKGANYVTCPSVATGRGVGGTTASSHSGGATVQMNVTAEDLRGIQTGESNTGMHTYFDESFRDYVLSGGTVAQATGLIASISSGVAYINGRRLTFGAMSKTFTASKDTYVDIIETDGSNIATVSYTELASGATGSAPVSNGMHIAKVNTTASAIATSVQAFTDSLGNPIKQTSPVSAVGIYNPYKFRANRTAAQNTSAGAFAKINFDTEDFDTNGNFDSTTNFRYTAPVDGFYLFSGGFVLAGNGGAFVFCALYKNGVSISRGSQNNASAATGSNITDLVLASAGDYFELFGFASNTIGYDIGSTNKPYFNGFLVSRT